MSKLRAYIESWLAQNGTEGVWDYQIKGIYTLNCRLVAVSGES